MRAVPTTPIYDGLNVDQRLAIERLLFERMTGGPYTERSIPDDASDKKREYLVSCIRDACHRLPDGAVPQHQLSAVREFSARATVKGGSVALVAVADLKVRVQEAMVAAIPRLPHDLVRLEEEARQAIANGAEEKIPRRKIAERFLTPLGYEYVKARSGPGSSAFSKVTAAGASLSCDFDFGSWRRTVMAIFVYSELGCRVTMPLRYSASERETAILGKELFEKTIDNVAFVLAEIEAVLT